MNPFKEIPEDKMADLVNRLIDRGNGSASHASLSAGPRKTGDGCPPESHWQAIAGGQRSDNESEAGIEHAAHCQRCGAILKFWAEILSREETPEETTVLARLSSQSKAWQERMTTALVAASRNHRGSTVHRWPGRIGWPTILALAGAAAAGGLCFLFLQNSRAQSSPEHLLAEAYTARRTMDTRIPLAGFAVVSAERHTRGAAANAMSDSVPLLEARAAISQALMKTPEDSHWLLLQARSDLLSESYDTAIDTLKRLHAADPSNVAVLTDLASAYRMRSKANDAPVDDATALDYLAQAARDDPKNSVVLYNEAVVLQELYQYSNATDVWNQFLAVEHDPAWVADGKRRLAEIEAQEAKVKAGQSLLEPMLASPNEMLHLARSPAIIAAYDEELSTIYFPKLLQTAFPLRSAANPQQTHSFTPAYDCLADCNAARELLSAIARSLEVHHQDQWLSDLMAASGNAGFVKAINQLAEGIDTGQHSNFPEGLKKTQEAQSSFEHLGNLAGVTRARIEEVFNLEHLLDDRRCQAAAEGLPAIFARQRYPWMAAQFWADDAACHEQQNDFAESLACLRRSTDMSSEADYKIIHIRAIGFLAAIEATIGNRDLTWRVSLQGLRDYWNGGYPPVRKAQFYGNLNRTEEPSSRVYSALLMRREALREMSLLNVAQAFNANRFFLVQAEIRAGEIQEAAKDFQAANSERTALDLHWGSKSNFDDLAVWLAQAYLTREDTADAASMLKLVSQDIAGTDNRDIELGYATAMGELLLLNGEMEKAETELTQAAALAELGYRDTRGSQEKIAWIEKARPVYAGLASLRLREGKSPIEALAIWERYRVLSSGVPLPSFCQGDDLSCLAPALENLRRSLNDQTILGSIRLDRSLLLWTMDNRGLQFHEVAIDPEQFDLFCHAFADTLATPSSSEASIRFYGERIAHELLASPLPGLDSRRTLVFDLDDTMEFLPTAVLPVNGKYLGLQFATSTLHSMLLADRRASATNRLQQGLVVGASDPGDPDVPRLPEARTEAEAVAAFLVRSRVFVGSDAQAGPIAANAPHAALIHFAGHTQTVGGNTRLLLAGADRAGQHAKAGANWLDAGTFRPHNLSGCRLVVLSACSTGKREERDFDDIQDIVQTLAASGAQQIVATHWDVDSAASAVLMKTFYSGLARGLTVPRALLEAKNALSASAEYRHPYYWAPYYVFGMSKSNLMELFHND